MLTLIAIAVAFVSVAFPASVIVASMVRDLLSDDADSKLAWAWGGLVASLASLTGDTGLPPQRSRRGLHACHKGQQTCARVAVDGSAVECQVNDIKRRVQVPVMLPVLLSPEGKAAYRSNRSNKTVRAVMDVSARVSTANAIARPSEAPQSLLRHIALELAHFIMGERHMTRRRLQRLHR